MTPWTVAHQVPLSLGFFRQEYWIGLPFPTPGDLPKPRVQTVSPVSPEKQVDSLPDDPSLIYKVPFITNSSSEFIIHSEFMYTSFLL